VTLDRLEDDLDYHLVLRSGSRTMIAETPSPLCTNGATAYRRRQMRDSGRVWPGSVGARGWAASPSWTSSTGRPASLVDAAMIRRTFLPCRLLVKT
jgi:hypothetical protein